MGFPRFILTSDDASNLHIVSPNSRGEKLHLNILFVYTCRYLLVYVAPNLGTILIAGVPGKKP